MRSTTVAVAMNVVPIGLGYLYIKEYSRFALAFFGGATGLFTAVVLTGLLSLGSCFMGSCSTAERLLVWLPVAIPAILSLITVIDACKRRPKARKRRR